MKKLDVRGEVLTIPADAGSGVDNGFWVREIYQI